MDGDLRRAAGSIAATVAIIALNVLPAVVRAEDCRPHIEDAAGSAVIRFRAHDNAFLNCPVSEATFVSTMRSWLRLSEGRDTVAEELFLGRAVHYPWLSRHIEQAALEHRHWDGVRARPVDGHINVFVAELLSAAPLRERLAPAFAGSRYRAGAASVEKVLVRQASRAGADAQSVPYDALVWINLRRDE